MIPNWHWKMAAASSHCVSLLASVISLLLFWLSSCLSESPYFSLDFFFFNTNPFNISVPGSPSLALALFIKGALGTVPCLLTSTIIHKLNASSSSRKLWSADLYIWLPHRCLYLEVLSIVPDGQIHSYCIHNTSSSIELLFILNCLHTFHY